MNGIEIVDCHQPSDSIELNVEVDESRNVAVILTSYEHDTCIADVEEASIRIDKYGIMKLRDFLTEVLDKYEHLY